MQCLLMRCATFLSPTTRQQLSGLWVCALTGVLAQVQTTSSSFDRTFAVRDMPIPPAVRAGMGQQMSDSQECKYISVLD